MPTEPPSTRPYVVADYFDSHSAQAHPVVVHVEDGRLLARGPGVALDLPLGAVQWPERQRHGGKTARLGDGAVLHARRDQSWQVLHRRPDSAVIWMQQTWRGGVLSLIGLIVVLAIAWLWGMDMLSRSIVSIVPEAVDRTLGERVEQYAMHQLLAPTRLDVSEQERIQSAFADTIARAWPDGNAPHYVLRFADGKRTGPNAFALPGGTLIVTDEMVKLAREADGKLSAQSLTMIVGVLGHEMGHVEHRHGMRGLVRAMLISLFAGIILGDVSSVVTMAPPLLLRNAFTRDAERQADASAVRILKASGQSPEALALLFERLQRSLKVSPETEKLAIGVSGHPPTTERILYFRREARSGPAP